ncbi:LysR substrate-binding domain-containing protein [Cognaticolwellia mytili]|uniref:LysR substrate-binding domain-containing protein n=1 Tax=Cognaticolwellia mytili TaxID=1888913 RepID=UPI001301EBED|nr:LysR substrate-binding domain-containing protein [Cognaticolwellia mytili]
MPPLKSLQVFLCAARHHSFKRAAEELFVTQAAISQQIRLLENYFDTPLFIRENKQTRLNAQGQRLFPYIENAFEQIELGVNAVSGEPNASELKVSALHSLTSLILIPRINDFQEKNSDVCVQFIPNNHLDSFMLHNVDIAIRRGLGDYDGLESRKLIDDEIILVASPLLPGVDSQDPATILALTLLEDTSSDIQEAIDDCCVTFGFVKADLNTCLRTTDALPIIQNVLAGQGIAFVSRALVNKNIQSGQLLNLLDYAFDSPRTLYLVAPPQHFNWPKVKRFEQWAQKLFSSEP